MSSSATVCVPASSANLGPGFDSIGIALDIFDTVTARLVDTPGVRVTITGNGADTLAHDAGHLVAQVFLIAAGQFGLHVEGLELECVNQIPQGRGLGSSASAIIAGLVLARELSGADISQERLLQLANVIEGHADNISACLLGGLTVATWENLDDVQAVSLSVHPTVVAVVGIPASELSTEKARGLLPDEVPYAAAVHNASRAAMLVAALTQRPDMLLAATSDQLHQNYRRAAYPDSLNLVDTLRSSGFAAAISGAGPSVLVLTTIDRADAAGAVILQAGFESRQVGICAQGATIQG